MERVGDQSKEMTASKILNSCIEYYHICIKAGSRFSWIAGRIQNTMYKYFCTQESWYLNGGARTFRRLLQKVY